MVKQEQEKNWKEGSLLDCIADRMGCMYLSDLRYLDRPGRCFLADFVLPEIRSDEVPLFEWNNALTYLTGAKPGDHPEQVRQTLIRILRGI